MADTRIGRRKRAPRAKSRQRDGRGAGKSGASGARQALDRYLALARAAAADGDPVASESYYQHADHYYRLMRQAAEA